MFLTQDDNNKNQGKIIIIENTVDAINVYLYLFVILALYMRVFWSFVWY